MGPTATARVQAGLGISSTFLVSLARPRGRDLETVFSMARVCLSLFHANKIQSDAQSWKHLALVQSGILHKPGKELRVRAVERLPFCTLGWVPEHEATLLLLLLNPTSKNDI